MFSPTLGRFVTTDPIGFQAGDVNLYRFVSNDPLNATDPTGLEESPWSPKQRELLKKLPNPNKNLDGTPRQLLKAGKFTVNMSTYKKGIAAGIHGTVEFTPGSDCPNCKQIKIIQNLRMVHDEDGRVAEDTLTGTKGALNTPTPHGVLANAQRLLGIQGGWHVDVNAEIIKKFGTPSLYYQDNVQNMAHRIGSSGQGKGQAPSIIYDDPHTSLSGIRFEFESVAVCVDTNQVLGSVRWGFVTVADKDLNLSAELLPPYEGYITDTPSPSFYAAIGKFNSYFKKK
jgi:hypothetical protein